MIGVAGKGSQMCFLGLSNPGALVELVRKRTKVLNERNISVMIDKVQVWVI